MRSKTLWREQIVEKQAGDRISEIEDRRVEINESERKKNNELKEMRTISETSRTVLNAPTFES